MIILGISAFYHDSAACLIIDGVIISAAQEERFTRKKHDQSFPRKAIDYCLTFSKLEARNIDYVVFYDKPFLKFDRLLETYLTYSPFGIKSFIKSFIIWLKDKLFQKLIILKELRTAYGVNINWDEKLLFSEHHLSHAASAFFPSPFEDAAVLTMDGVGEWVTTSLAVGEKNKLTVLKEINFPHSIGLLYSAFTFFIGFKVNSGEYKVMGLAPYGEPRYANLIKKHLIDIKEDGSFKLDMSYFNYCAGLTMTSTKFNNLFGGLPREPESPITQREMDLAASIQSVVEEVIIKIVTFTKKISGKKNLCIAGGVALNCVANGKLLKSGIFENIWIQPASGDAGGSIGAALAVHFLMLKHPREIVFPDAMFGSYLGPEYSQTYIEDTLKEIGASFEILPDDDLYSITAKYLAEGKAIGWHQGRMEFGPRALGSRSIIADPRSPFIQKQLNLKIKFRESFRPFAPSILSEEVKNWFDLNHESPYMLFVANIIESVKTINYDHQERKFGFDRLNVQRSTIPAVTHVDYTARIQTVHKKTNPRFHSLLNKFMELTNCPILVNTSFNIRGEPIVCTPNDSYRCFMGTNIDILVIGNCLLKKNDQNKNLINSYASTYTLD